jgi:hypothetical protein
MKQTIARMIMGAGMAVLMIGGFTGCTKQAKDADMMSTAAGRSSNSTNLKMQYKANLNPLNNSGVSGTAMLTLEGKMLTVEINATGLEANKLHPQHIHGFIDNNRNSICPTMSFDTNGDGILTLAETVPAYGPVLLELAPLPTANAQGEIHYMHTFEINPSLLPLQNRAIVLHGLTVNGQYIASLPVACGQVMVSVQ